MLDLEWGARNAIVHGPSLVKLSPLQPPALSLEAILDWFKCLHLNASVLFARMLVWREE